MPLNMFDKKEYTIASYRVTRIEHKQGAFMEIIPELGAMVHRVGLRNGVGNILSIVECDSADELSENPWFRGRILFPFNDRIPRGRYSFNGTEYQLPINCAEDQSSIHGLVYQREFSEVSRSENEDSASIAYCCSIDKKDYPSYPFSVDLTLVYTLGLHDVSIRYSVVNRDQKTLPFALGWHPYFTLGTEINALRLMCGGESYVAVDKDLNPTGEILPVKGSDLDFSILKKIGEGELDIALSSSETGIAVLEDDKNSLELTFDRDFFSFVQLFTPPGRKSIAIEPISAATNSFNIDGLGKVVLSPGEERSGSVSISLKSSS